ncbi:MAG: putative hydrolase [Acidimicrobiia bacterium]|nr:putative hydrolase [Acidimicrobiia bacterium]
MKDAGIFFDFFGTLVGYEPDLASISYPKSHQLLVSWGHSLTHDGFVAWWSEAASGLETAALHSHEEYSMFDTAAAFEAAGDCRLTDRKRRLLIATFLAEWRLHVRPIPGAADMLRRLAQTSRLGIVSNTHDPTMVHELLLAFDMADVFDVVVLSVDHGYRKPHESIYRRALAQLGCAAANSVFVGDSYVADFVGPRALGMTAYLIDPSNLHAVPESQRLPSILDLEARLHR